MNIFKIDKEFEKRKHIDSILVNMSIPIIIFIISLFSNFGFLFDFRNDDISFFYRFIVIFIIWLIIVMLLYLLIYLIDEVLILHKQNVKAKKLVFLMKNNFHATISLFKYNIIFITIFCIFFYFNIFSYLNKILFKSRIDLILKIIMCILILLLIVVIFWIIKELIRKKANVKFFQCKSFYYVLKIIICCFISTIIIVFLLFFNNKRNIDIHFNKNGLVEVKFDYGIHNNEHLTFQIYNKNILLDSQFAINNKLNSVEWHDSHNKNIISTMSIVGYYDDLFKEISPLNFYLPRIENFYYFDLGKYIINNKISKNDLDDDYSIVLIIESKKYKFIVHNQFRIILDNYEFAKDSMHISLWPLI